MNPIVYAIPVFFALMLIEFGVAHARGRRAYRINDTLGSLSAGVTSQITEIATKLVVIGIYAFCFEHLRVTTLPVDAWWTWLLGLLLYDFLYYWHHRMGHEVGILWASHVVHHSSEEFNLSTALRQTSTRFLLGWIFYLPMAVLGFPMIVFIVVGLIDLLYQYWIHTEQVGKLGWFDRVFASPSNHRVHHAVNDKYLDRNYGGILILWDRMFGTFIDEDDNEPCVYGTRSRLGTFSPWWANLEVRFIVRAQRPQVFLALVLVVVNRLGKLRERRAFPLGNIRSRDTVQRQRFCVTIRKRGHHFPGPCRRQSAQSDECGHRCRNL